MTNTIAAGTYGFCTVYEDFTNQQSSTRNYRVVKIVFDRYDEEVGRTNEIIAVQSGQTVAVYQNLNNYESVTFRLFRRDYSTDGSYEETKIWEKSTSAPFIAVGPR